MRDIKFRGKKINYGEWIYGVPIFDGDKAWIVKRIGDNFSADEVHPETVGQYTGLPDRKAAEIYNGDLCKDGDGKSLLQIVWAKNHQWGVKVLKGGALTEGLTFPLWHWDNCPQNDNRQLEVIGNIHDNPELLQPQGGGKGE